MSIKQDFKTGKLNLTVPDAGLLKLWKLESKASTASHILIIVFIIFLISRSLGFW